MDHTEEIDIVEEASERNVGGTQNSAQLQLHRKLTKMKGLILTALAKIESANEQIQEAYKQIGQVCDAIDPELFGIENGNILIPNHGGQPAAPPAAGNTEQLSGNWGGMTINHAGSSGKHFKRRDSGLSAFRPNF